MVRARIKLINYVILGIGLLITSGCLQFQEEKDSTVIPNSIVVATPVIPNTTVVPTTANLTEQPISMVTLPGNYLYITEKPWSGWIKEQPKETNLMIKVEKEGQEINLNGFISAKLKVLSFDSQKIKLLSNGADVKEGVTSTINLSNCGEQEFVVRGGQTFSLATCTLDSGMTWIIKYSVNLSNQTQ